MVGVTEAPSESVPLPVEELATLRVAFGVPIEGGPLSIEVFDSGKCIFPCDEFANFKSLSMYQTTTAKGFSILAWQL